MVHYCIDCHFLCLTHQFGSEEVSGAARTRIRERNKDWRGGDPGHPRCYNEEWDSSSPNGADAFEEVLTKERTTCDFAGYLPGVGFKVIERRKQKWITRRATIIAMATLVIAALGLALNLIQFIGRSGALPVSTPITPLPTITPLP